MKSFNLKKTFVGFVTAFLISTMAIGALAQKPQSKVVFEIIKVALPDSIVFTVAKGETVSGGISVSLVSGEEVFEGGTYLMPSKFIMDAKTGKKSFTNETRLGADNFKVRSGFKPKKIKFETDDTTFYYDIAKSAWDK